MTAIAPDNAPAVRPYQPLAPAAVAFVVGVVAGDVVGGGMLVWCGVALVAAAAWAVSCLRGVSDRWLLVPLVILVGAAGAARYRAAVEPMPDDVARLVADGRRLVTLEGTVVRSARQTSPPDDVFLPTVPYYIHSTLTLECERVQTEGRWFPARGRVSTTVRQAMPTEGRGGVPDLGDRVQITGSLAPFGQPANPGAFDVGAYLRRQGVRASLSTKYWEAVRVVEPAADKPRWVLGAMQRWAVARVKTLPTTEGQAIVAAMLFGRRDLMDFDAGQVHGRDIERAFLVTGTTHYLAVSGFNVGMVAATVLLLARLLGLGRRPTAVLVAAAALAFAMMTELEPPVVRAAILFSALCLGWFMGRQVLNLNALTASVFVILLVRPGDLFTTSFQLSFLAVLGMMYVVHRLETDFLGRYRQVQRLRDPSPLGSFWYRRVVRGTILVSLAAALVNVPLVATRFHLVAWLAPLASTLLFPLVFVLTVTGLVHVSVGWLAPWLGAVLAVVPDGLGRATASLVQALAHVHGAYIYVSEISPAWLAVMYGLLIAWVWRRRTGLSRRRLAIVALALAAAFVWTQGHRAPSAVRATFLAVGNGNTNLLELPNGRNLLYDAGSALSNARAAETTIAPALWARHVDRLDAVFFSHAHFDHFKDILPLVERFGVPQVFVPPTFVRKRLRCDKTAIEALLARGVRVEFFGAGDTLGGTGGVEVAAVWPQGGKSQTQAINDGSLVLAVTDRGHRLLLTGDLTPASMAALGEAAPHLRADAMLWPHHGHEPQAVGEFVRRTGARVLVVSAGRPFTPLPEPAWMKEGRIACYHTGEVGAVTLELRPEGIYAETFATGPQMMVDTPAAADDETDTDEAGED